MLLAGVTIEKPEDRSIEMPFQSASITVIEPFAQILGIPKSGKGAARPLLQSLGIRTGRWSGVRSFTS